MLMQGQQLVLKNVIGQLRAHLLNAALGQVTLLWIIGPCHHVNVRVVLLIVEGSAPPKAAGRNFHRRCQLCLMSQQQSAPALTVLITQPRSIFSLQGIDEGPYRTSVCIDLFHSLIQIRSTVRSEQAMRAGTLSHVFQVATRRRFNHFYTIPCGNVLGIMSTAAAWLDIAGLLNKTVHSVISFWNRNASSKSISPLVSFTFFTQRTRSFCSLSRSTLLR